MQIIINSEVYKDYIRTTMARLDISASVDDIRNAEDTVELKDNLIPELEAELQDVFDHVLHDMIWSDESLFVLAENSTTLTFGQTLALGKLLTKVLDLSMTLYNIPLTDLLCISVKIKDENGNIILEMSPQ